MARVLIGRRLKDFMPKSTPALRLQRKRLAKRLRNGRTRDMETRIGESRSRNRWSIARSLDSLGATGTFMKRRITAVRAKLGPNRIIRVLDLGAGEGYVSSDLCAGIPKSKLDLHVLGLTRARAQYPGTGILMDLSLRKQLRRTKFWSVLWKIIVSAKNMILFFRLRGQLFTGQMFLLQWKKFAML